MFTEERTGNRFSWNQLGNISEGRPNLGMSCPVVAYRLMQFSLRDVLLDEFGPEKANEILRNAGYLAGREFCRNILNKDLPMEEFISHLQQELKDHAIGILKIEKADIQNLQFVLAVEEDLDCSGLPVTGKTVCNYDEGFFAGILQEYSKKMFIVQEVDCWASGDRVCRFMAEATGD